jgi:isoleucyl-tRNA synthetase
VPALAKAMKLDSVPRELARLTGRELEGMRARHPWLDRDVPIVLADYVTLDSGTGLVHTAPGHGTTTIRPGLKNGLDVYAPVDGRGRFTDEVPEWKGERVFDADRRSSSTSARRERSRRGAVPSQLSALLALQERDRLPRDRAVVHRHRPRESPPPCARRDRSRAWVPAWGRERIHNMIANRPDWCISRQRDWGVPVVAFFCERCDTPHATRAICEHVAGIFETEGADAWFKRPVEDLVPPSSRARSAENDVPARDRHPGRVVRLRLLVGGRRREASRARPRRHVPRGLGPASRLVPFGAAHARRRGRAGAVRRRPDARLHARPAGREAVEVAGNAIAPDQVIKKHGAEILRLWVAAEDYREDVTISDEILNNFVEAYRRIRNTVRFLLSNLFDFDPARDAVPYAALPELDRWALHRTAVLAAKVRAGTTRTSSTRSSTPSTTSARSTCRRSTSTSGRTVLYCEGPASRERRATQTALAAIADALVRLMAPILSFTADEAWGFLPARTRPRACSLAGFPDVPDEWNDAALGERYAKLLDLAARSRRRWRRRGRAGS